MVNLQKGAKGTEVKKLQELLNQRLRPSPKLDTDGEFGPATEGAVKTFQKQNRLTANGVAGRETLALLNGDGAPEPAPAAGGKGTVTGPTNGVEAILVEALQAVADHYGVTLQVTSGKRSVTDQARAMWNNWKGNLKEGLLYAALQRDKVLLEKLRKAYAEGDRKTFDAEVVKVAPKLSLHLAGKAVDLKKNTDPKAVKALATMFNHIAEKTCHHFDTKKKPSRIDDAAKAKWPK